MCISACKAELQLDLQKLAEEPFFVVPHEKEAVEPLTDQAVDVFWEKRRYGESWDGVEAPSGFFNGEDKGIDMESKSKHAYKKLIFDLTGDILRDIYQDEEELEQEAWTKPKRTRKKYHRGKSAPTTSSAIKPVLQEQVQRHLGLHKQNTKDTKANKWSSRKKRDHVDNVLLQELAEEEPYWVDYNDDELTVKMQIADSIFESLLGEAAKTFVDIAERKGSK